MLMSVFYKVPWEMKSRRLRSEKMFTNVVCCLGIQRFLFLSIDEAHLVLQWYLYVVFQKLF